MPIVAGPGDPGSTLVLTRLWLNDVADPSDVMSFRIGAFTPTYGADGEIRKNAGGRLRLVLRAGVARSHSALIRRPTDSQWAWLVAHHRRLVTIRDPDGMKYVGIYLTLTRDRPVEGADMTLDLSEVTSSEAV
ncbi:MULTISPECIES: hypothetical protein [unclassified Nocardioides]|uniref:hypothetical protein n=1 Tax=unclassified Nocardioides TaxID=2615069 RepID=UPI0009F0B34C|nr:MULTISPECIES: hypothetical protein [unclassified Nocardioides]GAW50619.1 uncharacterized protein PD653B2_2955 [Nocardioides sp. PD653-B2]GAW55518.1 uncharacterized protein PD653_2943 [Nocardioides sp. PD653]